MKTFLSNIVGTASQAACKIGQKQVVPALTGAAHQIKNIDIKEAMPVVVAAGNWMAANPGKAALYATSGLTILVPGVISAPILWATGFGVTGVQAGSAAAAYQAGAGPIVAKGLFATLQSCGMGGYGVATVHTATQVGAAVVGALGVGANVAARAAKD